MLSFGFLASALCALVLLPGTLGLGHCGGRVRFRGSPQPSAPAPAPVPAPPHGDKAPHSLLAFPVQLLWEGLDWLDAAGVFSMAWQAPCLLSTALLVHSLGTFVRQPRRRKTLRGAADGPEAKSWHYRSYDVLGHVEGNVMLMSKYLRRLRCLWQEEDAMRLGLKRKAEEL